MNATYPMSLLELSDAVRRRQSDEGFDMKKVALATRDMAAYITNYEPTESSMTKKFNENIVNKITACLHVIDDELSKTNVSDVELPFCADFAQVAPALTLALRNANDLKLPFFFAEEEYNIDLSFLGAIDPDVRTVLDDDLKGMVHVSDDIRLKWAHEVKVGDSYELDI